VQSADVPFQRAGRDWKHAENTAGRILVSEMSARFPIAGARLRIPVIVWLQRHGWLLHEDEVTPLVKLCRRATASRLQVGFRDSIFTY